jgi:hypothetical protein
MNYYSGAIRELIKDALTSDQLKDLISDDFYSLYNDVKDRSLPDQRRELLDYAQKNGEIPDLLNAIEKINPKVFQEFKDKLNEQESLQTLSNILTPIKFAEVVRVFRVSLPEVPHYQIPNTLDALLKYVADIPGEQNKTKPLWQFINFLIQETSLEVKHKDAIKAWAKTQNIPVDAANVMVQQQSKAKETYLMIKVKLHPPGEKYLVSAAISEDPTPFQLEKKTKETYLDIAIPPDPQYSPGYSQAQLPDILSELIASCGSQVALSDLVVQWFLPLELISLPVEHWQIKIGRQNPTSWERCKTVIIRSSDRHFSADYRSVLGEWKKYWKCLLNNLESISGGSLASLDSMTTVAEIIRGDNTVIGCKFIEHEDSDYQINFWDNLLGQGLPIALWSRHPSPDQTETMEIINAVAGCTLVELPNSLTQHRRESQASPAQLSLLWDNPFRPFPDIQYESY